MTDLYAILGLHNSNLAYTAEIKAAYHRRAKETHPDAGGNAAEFHDVQMAYEVLSDPERRARYDRDGDTRKEAIGEDERIAHSIVGTMMNGIINEILGAGGGPDISIQTNVIERMQSVLGEALGNMERALVRIDENIACLERLTAKFSATEGDNVLSAMITAKIEHLRHDIPRIHDDRRRHQMALELLKRHAFAVDPPPMPLPIYEQGPFGLTAQVQHFQGQPGFR